MKSCDEMVGSLLERRDKYAAERKKRVKAVTGIACSAACCALIVCMIPIVRKNAEQVRPDPAHAVGSTLNGEPAAPVQDANSPAPFPAPSEEAGPTAAPVQEPGPTATPRLPEVTAAPDAEPTDSPSVHGERPAEQPGESVYVPESGGEVTQVPEPAGSAEFFALFWWKNKFVVGGQLRMWLESGDGTAHSVTGVYRPTVEALRGVTDFVYEGRTLAEWIADVEYEWRLAQLIKVGGAMKYGTALYETGTPDGEKWTKSEYDFEVGYIGEDILARYIVGGELLADELRADYEACGGRAEATYAEVVGAYVEYRTARAAEALSAAGMPAETGSWGEMFPSVVRFTATAAQFEAMPVTDLASWWFM